MSCWLTKKNTHDVEEIQKSIEDNSMFSIKFCASNSLLFP